MFLILLRVLILRPLLVLLLSILILLLVAILVLLLLPVLLDLAGGYVGDYCAADDTGSCGKGIVGLLVGEDTAGDTADEGTSESALSGYRLAVRAVFDGAF